VRKCRREFISRAAAVAATTTAAAAAAAVAPTAPRTSSTVQSMPK